MSKADKMFEEMGYKKIADDKYRIIYTFYRVEIVFKKGLKQVSTDGMTIREHLAIHEKMRELGWIE